MSRELRKTGEPEHISNTLSTLLAGVQERPSGVCGMCAQKFDYLDANPDVIQRCANCERIWNDGKAILDSLDGHVMQMLTRAGLETRELSAQLQQIPEVIAVRLPQETVRAMFRGETPKRAFALIGAPGAGKTFAMAAIFARMARNRIASRAMIEGQESLRDWLYWLPWPETVNRIRVMSMRDGGIRDVQAIVDAAIEAEALVLDDIGAERIRGPFQDDAAASKLEVIVDGRHRAMRPTWFTSNRCDSLDDRYGGRLVRRLFEDVDAAKLPLPPGYES